MRNACQALSPLTTLRFIGSTRPCTTSCSSWYTEGMTGCWAAARIRTKDHPNNHWHGVVLQSFPIPAEKLIALAQKVFLEDEVGICSLVNGRHTIVCALPLSCWSAVQVGRKNPDVLAPDFKFEFPIIKLNKQVGGSLLCSTIMFTSLLVLINAPCAEIS